jgi:type IV pilus assembly protein PilW
MNLNFSRFTIQNGLSLIELMVAIGIGSLLMLGLTTTFKNSSDTQRELERSGRLIENGRYAVDTLSNDLRHAGYYGHYFEALATPGSLPDPCEVASTANLKTALAMPVQGYTTDTNLGIRPTISATTCDDKGLFVDANLSLGSDILVIRRASTQLYTTTVPSTENNRIFIQANPREANILRASTGQVVPNVAVDGSAAIFKYPYDPSNTTPAETYEFIVNSYFVAPCSFGSGANGICAAGDDTVPTLKRLELSSDGTNTIMSIVPLVEGVEFMKVSYGIDNSPSTISLTTGFAGDGIPDTYVTAPSLAQWPLVVAIRIYLLVRATESTTAFSDTKTYSFSPFSTATASLNVAAFNDAFKRHVYSTEVRPMNLAGRREIP